MASGPSATFDEAFFTRLASDFEKRGPNPISQWPLDEWCQAAEISKAAFYDRFAAHLAHEFLDGRLSFYVANNAANDLFGFICHSDEEGWPPQFTWEVFQAFDAGEYIHSRNGDGPDIDP